MVQTFVNTHLQNQSFQGQSLTGRNFSHAPLMGADFSNTDIRGANFYGAQLQNANFSHVLAGHQPHTRIVLLLFASLLTILSGLVLGVASLFSAGIFQPYFIQEYNIPPVLVLLISLAVFIKFTMQKGFLLGMLFMTLAIAGQATIVGIFQGSLPGVGASALIMALGVIGVSAGATVGGLILALTRLKLRILTLWGGVVFAVATGIIGTLANAINQKVAVSSYDLVFTEMSSTIGAKNIAKALSAIANSTAPGAVQIMPLAVAIAIAIALTLIFLAGYTSWYSLSDRPEFIVTRRLVLTLAAIGGTDFQTSNLTEANFAAADLPNTNFSKAQIKGVDWFEAKRLELARLGESYLQNPHIRRLAVTKSAQGQTFDGLILRGINLSGANLSTSSFIEADLSEADLKYADLSHAKLVRTQLSQADLTGACLTGANIEDWGMSSETILHEVICNYVFTHLPTDEDPDPGRKPDNKKEFFAPGDFADFIEPLRQTLDLFHHQDVNIREIAIVLNQLIENHPEADLKVAAIERRGAQGDSVLIRLTTELDANLSELEQEYSTSYDRLKILSNQQLYTLLEQKDRQIQMYGDWLRTVLNPGFAPDPLPLSGNWEAKRVNWIVGEGDFHQGFPVTVQIGSEGTLHSRQAVAHLPPAPEIAQTYKRWQTSYRLIGTLFRIKAKATQLKNVSVQPIASPDPLLLECRSAAAAIATHFNTWLNSAEFRAIEQSLCEELQRSDEVRVIVQVQDPELRRLPWHLWNWFERYSKAEVSLGSLAARRVDRTTPPKAKLRVLVVLGSNTGINVNADQKLLEGLAHADVATLSEPSRQRLDEVLFDPQGWDILCFAGHSQSEPQGNNGWLYLNEEESLSLDQIQNALTTAIARGLKMVILNSCDGLGLAFKLATLNLPQMIVMREPVPDLVAQTFLQHFLASFASGKSLYVAVREAREQLQRLENEYPCASWMPVICQNPSEVVWTWEEMQGVNQLQLDHAIAQVKVEVINHPDLPAPKQAEVCDYLQALSLAVHNLQTPEGHRLGKNAIVYLKTVAAEYSETPSTAALSASLTQLLTSISDNFTRRTS